MPALILPKDDVLKLIINNNLLFPGARKVGRLTSRKCLPRYWATTITMTALNETRRHLPNVNLRRTGNDVCFIDAHKVGWGVRSEKLLAVFDNWTSIIGPPVETYDQSKRLRGHSNNTWHFFRTLRPPPHPPCDTCSTFSSEITHTNCHVTFLLINYCFVKIVWFYLVPPNNWFIKVISKTSVTSHNTIIQNVSTNFNIKLFNSLIN
jgi:hypothetical protein